ncbi:MAG: NACHT domain-containing protein [Thermoflexales bacterium]|nr:NACHT domain-containing protein [Thermoflexales bacterium]
MNYDDTIFEDEVRRIARHLWPEAEFDGSRIISGRECDGVFITEDCIHLIEATTSRQRAKARGDAKKLDGLAKQFQRRYSDKAVKCWFITQQEPTGDQREEVRQFKGSVVPLSFAHFQSRLIDTKSYLSARNNYSFGSVRDPETDSLNPTVEYVPLDLVETGSSNLWSVGEICNRLVSGGRVLLLGDYGAGKSMTMREIYFELRKRHHKGHIPQFPVYLNLRDHIGQINPAEVLERHARNIGFASHSHLVRAWRAGYAILLLDGFDEISILGWVGVWKTLREVRYRSMQMIREFVQDTPPEAGLTMAGRAHFFDGEDECSKALAIDLSFVKLSLNDFTEKQITTYLEKHKFPKEGMPAWLPARPLLLGTLVAKGLLKGITQSDGMAKGVVDPAIGWNTLLDQVVRREAKIEAGIDGDTLKRILERLATKARVSQDGLGPLTSDQIIDAFKEICGYQPNELAMVLLQRLPGLGIDQVEEDTRRFIDEDWADVCRVGDVVEFANNPFAFDLELFANAECALRSLGISVAANRLSNLGYSSGKLNPALRKAAESYDAALLTTDLVRIAFEKQWPIQYNVYVKNTLIPDLELPKGMGAFSGIEFQECYFSRLEIDSDVDAAQLPRFRGCYFAEIDGVVSEAELPQNIFLGGCVFDSFSQTVETTNAILKLDLPIGVRVTLTVLKKLYLQAGAGRKESALCRGLDHRSRRLVPDILGLLQSEHLTTKIRRDETIWLPNRSETTRVRKILSSPSTCNDPLLTKSGEL